MIDIEKLRGLPEKWRDYKDGTKQGRDASESVSQRCARELEATGLNELLADYERLLHLLKARNTQLLEKSVDVAKLLSERKRLLRERPVYAYCDSACTLERHTAACEKRLDDLCKGAEQPPAVSENQRED